MKKNIRKLDNVVCVPCGMWSEKTELCFRAIGTQGTRIVEGTGQETIKIPVDSIDNVCSGDKVTFIKMDIEGSEIEALKGAVNVIKRDKPRLAICIYHRPEHLYEIPFLVKEMIPEYKLYVRHHNDNIWTDTVLYATL